MANKKLYKSGQKPSQKRKTSFLEMLLAPPPKASKKHNQRSHGTERKSTRGGKYGR